MKLAKISVLEFSGQPHDTGKIIRKKCQTIDHEKTSRNLAFLAAELLHFCVSKER